MPLTLFASRPELARPGPVKKLIVSGRKRPILRDLVLIFEYRTDPNAPVPAFDSSGRKTGLLTCSVSRSSWMRSEA